MYVAGHYSDSIVTWTRSLSTGALSNPSSITSNGDTVRLHRPISVSVSPDGINVYAVAHLSDSIVTWTRNLGTGTLSNPSSITHNGGTVKLDSANRVAVSPDGTNLYAVAYVSHSIVTWTRSLSTGSLSKPSSITDNGGTVKLENAYSVAISPDGTNVYAVGYASDSIVTWTRSLSTGALSNPSSVTHNGGTVKLLGPRTVAFSPDGTNVYAVGSDSDSIVTWTRSLSTGALSNPSSITHNGGTVKLDVPIGVSVSPDGFNLYAVGHESDSIVTFSRVCPPGSVFNSSTCVPCHFPLYQPSGESVVAVACSICNATTYAMTSSSACLPCPPWLSDPSPAASAYDPSVDRCVNSSVRVALLSADLTVASGLSAVQINESATRVVLSLAFASPVYVSNSSAGVRLFDAVPALGYEELSRCPSSVALEWPPSVSEFGLLVEADLTVLSTGVCFQGGQAHYHVANLSAALGDIVDAASGSLRWDCAGAGNLTIVTESRPSLVPLQSFVAVRHFVLRGAGFFNGTILQAWAGPVWEPFKFVLGVERLSDRRLDLTVPAWIVGSDLTARVRVDGVIAYVAPLAAPQLAAGPPRITAGSLSKADALPAPVLGFYATETATITFEGSGFGLRAADIEVRVGGLNCVVEAQVLTDTFVRCGVPPLSGSGASLPIVVTAGNLSSEAYRAQRISIIPGAVELRNLTGCPAAGCPTEGGIWVTLAGINFLEGATAEFAAGTTCKNTTVLSGTRLRCLLPSGAGQHIGTVIDIGGARSSSYPLLTYAAPTFEGPVGGGGPFERAGGSRITVLGRNFGGSGAQVFVGGFGQCTDVVHASHRNLSCSLPDGVGLGNSLTLFQFQGRVSVSAAPSVVDYQLCSPGRYAVDLTCAECPAGTYTSTNGSIWCQPCPSGHIAPNTTGSAACLPCPRDSTADASRVACVCDAGKQLNEADECELCPAGADCSAPGSVAGFVEASPGAWTPAASGGSFYSCPFGDRACRGGGAGCAAGYTGIVCAVCEDGYFLRNDECMECGSGSMAATIVLLVLGVVVIVTAGIWLRRHKRRLPLAQLSILVALLQILSVVPRVYMVPWPSFFVEFMSMLQLVLGDVLVVTGAACVGSLDFFDSLLFVTLVPLVLSALLAATYALAPWLVSARYVKDRKVVRTTSLKLLIVLMTLCYPVVSLKTLMTFVCRRIDGVWYLEADYSLSCEGGRYALYQAWATIVVLLVPVGWPCLVAMWLYKHRNEVGPSSAAGPKTTTRQRLGLLYRKYRPAVYYWEVTEILRKVGLGPFPPSCSRVLFLSLSPSLLYICC